jgi:adenylate kinase family enzyme
VFLGNNIEKFSKEVQLLYQQLRLIIDDEVSEKILNEISKFCGENPYAIIEGYPKYLKQALNFEKKIGVPNVVIFVNVN